MSEAQQYISVAQDKALTALTISSCFLSAVGSTLILVAVTRSRKTAGVYERLMFGMSICDLFATLNFVMQTFLTPRGTWALSLGNHSSCIAAGVIFQFGVLSSMIYYNVLALYFFLTIRCNMSAKVIEERLERWMHAIAFGWSTLSAVVGLFAESYAPLGLYQGCWRTGSKDNIATTVTMTPWFFTSFMIIPILFIIMYRGAWKAYRGSLLRQSNHTAGQGQRSTRESQQARRLQMLRGQAFLYVVAFYATYSFVLAGQIVENFATNPRHLIKRLYPLLVLQSIMTPLAGFFNCLVYLRPRYPLWRHGFDTDAGTGSRYFRMMRHGSSYFMTGISGSNPSARGQAAMDDHNHSIGNKNDQQKFNSRKGDRKEDKLQDFSSDLAPYDMNCVAPDESYVENAAQELATLQQNVVEDVVAP